MLFIGRIDVKKFKAVSDDIITDEVIITDERVQHIKERHPDDFERYCQYMRDIVEDPDYILSANKPNSAVLLKSIEVNGKKYKLILRLKTANDSDNYKNSVITFQKVENKRYARYTRSEKILYKSE